MTTPPGKVIRSLRQALDMSQAEFARAAGWSASTISSWERGTTTPSRLAFKTILAFAEERGVRYRPTGDAAAPGAGLPVPTSGLPTLRLGSRLPGAPLAARDGGREESFGSRRWTDVAASSVVLDVQPTVAVAERADAFDARVAAIEAARSAWTLDARVRVELGVGTPWLRRAAAAGAVLVALVVGAAAGTMLRSGRAPAPSSAGEHAGAPSSHSAARVVRAPIEAEDLVLTAGTAPALAAAPYAAGMAPDTATERAVTMPPPEHARLESIVALDGTRRATFRVGDRSIALVEGDDIGGRTIALIGNDEVALVGGGVATRVRLGFETPIR